VTGPGRGTHQRVTMADIVSAREQPGQTALLMLTDRCPVGCAHCSVDSRPDSPTISDRALLEAIVDGLCRDPQRWLVGITGGEPFVERWGLPAAVTRLRDAGKRIAVLTSGHWGTRDIPSWILEVLAVVDTLILSTDVFHAPGTDSGGVPAERFVNAARAASDAGCWVIVQHLADDASTGQAEGLLTDAFGAAAGERAERYAIPLLPTGRAQGLVPVALGRPGASFGRCEVLQAPVIRYDGTVVPCCNEDVTMGAGPAALRRAVRTSAALTDELARVRDDPLLEVIRGAGFGAVTQLPAFTDLAGRSFSGICDVCFAVHDRVAADATAGRQIDALAATIASRAPADRRRAADPAGSIGSIGSRLEAKVEIAYPLLASASARLFAAPDLADRYPEYLRAMHNVVCATVPLMDECLRVLAGQDDPLSTTLRAYFGEHIEEERGHDDLVLADLDALGLGPGFVRDRPPYAAAAALVGAQYYWIRHVHPVVLLGHVLVFEGRPMATERVEQLVASTGLPADAFGSLRLHAALDVDHRQELRRLLDRLDLPPRLEGALGVNALATVRHAADLIDGLAPPR
jgi:Iron-containing redox enzyme